MGSFISFKLSRRCAITIVNKTKPISTGSQKRTLMQEIEDTQPQERQRSHLVSENWINVSSSRDQANLLVKRFAARSWSRLVKAHLPKHPFPQKCTPSFNHKSNLIVQNTQCCFENMRRRIKTSLCLQMTILYNWKSGNV